jgi:hypothetical protein
VSDPSEVHGDVRVDVHRGEPTEEELAALIAVVSESYARESADALAEDEPIRTAWSLSQRSLRHPLRPEQGWGRYVG